ncbi:MAG: glycoside hydrolase family 92 protein, partial [Sedimentisphaerales bacterium]|nr:glycoside hydrolase family 92 protein [Sedimentisphaerales bacterium]
VFSAMGFYPVCPGSNEYVIGGPLFRKATINLENGKKFVINAPKNSAENIYIQSATTGLFKKQTKTYLTHEQITTGGKINFDMGPEPNPAWGSAPEDAPYSMSDEK